MSFAACGGRPLAVPYGLRMDAPADQRHITILLRALDDGDPTALDRLMQVVHEDLSRMAAAQLRGRYGDRVGELTLEPAALVNESFLRLIHQRQSFDNRGHFFSIATTIMLRVLGDYQRERAAQKRGGGQARTMLSYADEIEAPTANAEAVEIEALIAALDRLERLDRRKADIVRMRVVWGMTVPIIADALGVSPSSVERDWRFAKAWIATESLGG
jgi:RNA polymerase sigma factor (TIGR02999 family)